VNKGEFRLAREWNLNTRCRRSTKGTALIEAALVLPMLVFLMLNAINFAMYIYASVTVTNAARAAVEYQVYNGVVLGFPAPPSFTEVQSVVTADVSSLPNKTSVTLEVCTISNGTTTCQGTGSPYVPLPDPEPAIYRIYSAKVAYTFTCLFPGFTLPGSATITAQAAMRSME
jgi:TadE-like protein